MSLQNAEENLKEFGKELNLDGLEFDVNHTCILGIDNTFSLHLTYEPNTDRLYLYSPLLDGLPKDQATKLKLYEALLEAAMLGGQMLGGGIGVAPREELILMHSILDMGVGVDTASLRRTAPPFVQQVEMLREKIKLILEGQDPGPMGLAAAQTGIQQPGSKVGEAVPKKEGARPGDGFRKV